LNAELRKQKALAENDPEVKKLRDEAADLLAKTRAKEAEAKKLADTKFNSNESVKGILAKKHETESAIKELGEFKTGVMQSPQVKGLNDEVLKLQKESFLKNVELRKTMGEQLRKDKKMTELELKWRETTGEAAPMLGREPIGLPAGGNQPNAANLAGLAKLLGGKGQGALTPEMLKAAGNMNPELLTKLAGGKSSKDLTGLVGNYQRQKTGIESTTTSIKTILDTLPPDSPIVSKTKEGLASIGMPKLNPDLFTIQPKEKQ